MKFAYKNLYPGQVRPIIPISIYTPDNEVGYFAMVDSGADINLFPAELGEFLGLDIESGTEKTVAGIVQGESRPYYLHAIEIEVGDHRFTTQAGFMPDLSKNGYGLLGQHGFFDQFERIVFKKKEDVIEII